MFEYAQNLVDWVGAHPGLALVLLFVVATVDALFLLGAFVPAALVLFAVGALIALGGLNLWLATAVAAAGALTGDTLSFLVGRRYGDALFEWRWMRRYPDLIDHGRNFFNRHGGKGVMLARFLGPVRSITPALAGASGMSLVIFVLVDLPASVVWALIYLLPGVVFGASLSLAAEVATRLAGLLVISIGLLIAGVWLARTGLNLFNLHAEKLMRRLMNWSRRHRRLGRFGPALADPQQPETPALIAVASTLLLGGSLWLLLFGGVGQSIPGTLDAFVHQALSDLSTPWGTSIALYLSKLGEWPVYLSTAVTVFALLIWRRRLRAAAHWIAALLFGVAVTGLIHLMPLVSPPVRYFAQAENALLLRDLALPAVIYGFGATLYATLRPAAVRLASYAIAITLILLIALSRLILSTEWVTLNALALSLSLLWIFALTVGYRQHRPERLFSFSFAVPVGVAFVLAAATSWGTLRATRVNLPAPPVAAGEAMPLTQWWREGWASLPAARIDMRGQASIPFNLQWAGPLDEIEDTLIAHDWEVVPPIAAQDLMRWLTQTSPIGSLPVLPQVHAGRHPQLSLRRSIDADRQRLIRWWDSGLRLQRGEQAVPVWLGIHVQQQPRSVWGLIRYPVVSGEALRSAPLPADAQHAQLRLQRVRSEPTPLWLIGPPVSRYTEALEPAPVARPTPLEPADSP